MSEPPAFERVLASLYDAMLDDTHWPATAALIDEACGIAGNALMVGRRPAGRPPGPLRRALLPAGLAASSIRSSVEVCYQ